MVSEGYRRSPIRMDRPVLYTEVRNGWEIVTKYEDEADSPWIVDLSHAQKLDFRDSLLSHGLFLEISIPEKPGDIHIQGGFLSARLNPQQSLVLNLTKSPITDMEERSVTEVTDAFALLAMIGHSVFAILETITALDLLEPGKNPPFILQGPVLGLRSLLFLLSSEKDLPAILLAVPRGYGQSFFTALLQAGEPWNLSPAGESAFFHYFEHMAF